MTTKIAVIHNSSTGSVYRLARAVTEGAEKRAPRPLGVGRISLLCTAGAQPVGVRLRVVELYGTKVVPRVRDLLGG